MRVEELDEPAKRSRLEPRVTVEQHDVAADGGPGGGVVATGETRVGAHPDDADVGPSRLEMGDGAVARVVVGDDHLVSALGAVPQRLQAAVDEGFAVVGDEQHRHVGHGHRAPARTSCAAQYAAKASRTSSADTPKSSRS